MSKWSAAVLLLLLGCGSPFNGYKEVEDGVYLRYIKLGEGEQRAEDADSVLVRFRVARNGEEPGSYWSTERWYLVKDLSQGPLRPVFRRAHVGDSLSVIAPALSWPWKAMTGMEPDAASDTLLLCTELSMLAKRSPEEIRADAERLRANDPAEFERRLLNAYMQRSGEPWIRWGTSDMYYIISGTATDTARASYKEVVHLGWTGKRLEDGRVFDEQGRTGSGFSWSFGTPDQLIQGLETATSLLRQGQEGRFILPSSMAFGARGIPGTLEPWTPVIYTLRIQAIDRAH